MSAVFFDSPMRVRLAAAGMAFDSASPELRRALAQDARARAGLRLPKVPARLAIALDAEIELTQSWADFCRGIGYSRLR